ncbi:MAG TPA: TetR/AcrR family transcriptional regulator [Solirubrobacteraceae bacterium]|jgi:AcrR family transcriptional regulator|nr:TetR/AcrR family transcriptional regulator [Solirubrobacteraceae bacterium]
MGRQTRKQKQAQTRGSLMRSASKLFAERGLDNASIDDVAREAGFTKGAFYANFGSKEALFREMLDERFAKRTAEIKRLLAEESSDEEKARRAGDDFAQMLRSDPEWQRLLFEFTAYAVRNEDFRRELVARRRILRDTVAAALRERATELGLDPAVPIEQVARMTGAMAAGFAVERMLEGDGVPDELFGTMLLVFFAGLRVLAADAAPAL